MNDRICTKCHNKKSIPRTGYRQCDDCLLKDKIRKGLKK